MCVSKNEEFAQRNKRDRIELQSISETLQEQLNQLLAIVGEERSIANKEPREYKFRNLEKLAKQPKTPHPGTKVPTV
jgi:intein/homing endonuclease